MMDAAATRAGCAHEFGVLPPGDLLPLPGGALRRVAAAARSCSRSASPRRRWPAHSFGNLWLLALTRMLGSERDALEATLRLLQIRGRVSR